MIDDDFRVEVIGHATLRVQCNGRTLLTDPWLVDPIVCQNGFHFPPLVHDPAMIAAETDAIYVSHIHPDHFDPRSLELFDRSTPIYIGDYRRKTLRDRVHAFGFPVIEVPFQETVRVESTELAITLIEHDYEETGAGDSAIVIRTPAFAVFDNNDCFLRREKYLWIRDHFDVDYAFLGYSPASFFPISFELDAIEKARLLEESANRRYADFLEAAELLRARSAIPFANGLRFLHPAALWRNVAFSSATEAVRRLRAQGLAGDVMGPGDRIDCNGSIRHAGGVLAREDELAAIAAYAHSVEDWVTALADREPPARSDVVERFRNHMLALWRDARSRLPEVRRHVIAYVLRGSHEARFYFDFSQPEDRVFRWGDPPRYDMRYTYPASGLQLLLDGVIDWDELHFRNDVSVRQVAYARSFYAMLRSATLDLEPQRVGELRL